MARIEAYLRLDREDEVGTAGRPGVEEELEAKLGQEWFAKAGVTAIGVGVAFTLSRPYPGLPPVAPALLGYAAAASFWAAGRLWRRRSATVSGFFDGVAMALLYFGTLRLSFFGGAKAVDQGSAPASVLLSLASVANLAIAWRRKSSWLFALALATAYLTALAVGTPWFALSAIGIVSALAAATGIAIRRISPVATAMPLGYLATVLLALGDPLLGWSASPAANPFIVPGAILACVIAFAVGLFPRTEGVHEETIVNAASFFNAAAACGILLLSGLTETGGHFIAEELTASGALLGVAVLYSRKPNSVGSFLYAIAGHMALSFALIKATPAPEVYVWLSLQSLAVLATAIWFRSRFIVVANFFIFLGILAGYVASAREERGISIGFGLVALGTARLLAWKKDRLDLKTERMRNAYLVVVLLVFPYALYHLVPGAFIGPAWTAAAILYYGLGALLRNRKYRWMGHATLLLTTGYLVLVGTARLEPAYRNASFLLLGAALLAVSLLFKRLRKREN